MKPATPSSPDAVAPAERGAAVIQLPVGRNSPAAVAAAELPGVPVDAEILALLATELVDVQDTLMSVLEPVAAPDVTDEARREAAESYAGELERLAAAAEAAGLAALQRLLQWVIETLRASSEQGITAAQREPLEQLPGLALVYLSGPNDTGVCQDLAGLLRHPGWRKPMPQAEAQQLGRELAAVKAVKDVVHAPTRPEQATPADVSLELPPDLNRELLNGLLQELPRQVASFSEAVQRLTGGDGSLADIDIAKRAAHTLKGAANTVGGIKGIANLTHYLEDILLALSKHGLRPGSALAQTLVEAADCLEEMGEAVMGTGPEPRAPLPLLQAVLDWANRIDREGKDALEAETGTVAVMPPAVAPRAEAGATAAPAAAEPVAEQSVEPMILVPETVVDELLRLVGETIVSTSQVQEGLRNVGQQSKTIREQSGVFLKLAADLETLVDLRTAGETAQRGQFSPHFDPLEFEHYSELHSVSRRLIEAAHDSRALHAEVGDGLSNLSELIETQRRLHKESQEVVLRTRMVPVSTAVPRLQRSLRQACRLLSKRVELQVSGTDTPIDSHILNSLMDPLMHLLRNAVDHGIEAEALRVEHGKDPVGHVQLSFGREANHIVVRCQDDGAGLDLESIRRLAQERGLLDPGQAYSDEELTRAVLLPGFSTRTETTQVSGRGIGMDIVNSAILKMKGSLTLKSTPGAGLIVELRVPAALISTHALLVRLGNQLIATSTHGIQDIHYAEERQISSDGDAQFYHVGEQIFPLVELEQLLYAGHDRRGHARSGITVMMVRLDSGAVQAVRVQQIVDSRDLVVKGLGRYVPEIAGVVGAAILGDGSVTPVVDLPELMRGGTAQRQGGVGVATLSGEEPAVSPAVFTALVVDDSFSARRSTAQLLRDAGLEVRTAIDGLDAAAILDKWIPSVLLVDMEMPRMNGLELTVHVRGREQLAGLPIVMVTSRSSEKHREQAQAAGVDAYFTKPFRDDELLDRVTQLIGDRRD